MTIVCDRHITGFAECVQAGWPEVQIYPLEPEEIDSAAIQDADILVVRTRTRVDERLLAGSRVRLVCTATIGFDHIDTAYCEQHGIRWTACPGCNAQAVCDYIEESIDEIQNSKFKIQNCPTVGVIGVGHVGSLVAQMAERRGFNVLLNDPPKQIGVSIDGIARNCDVITYHVPLDDSTWHMCDAAFLRQCKPDALIINAARGGVVDEVALLRSGHPYIIDCWENEPNINNEVLQHAQLASMHIAGYSAEGKRNASQMCLDTIAGTFGLTPLTMPAPTAHGDTAPGWIARITDQLKNNPACFEQLRKTYTLR